MTSRIRKIVFAGMAMVMFLLSSHAYASMNPHCSNVGGAILTNVNGFGPNTTLGVATGDLRGALGVEIVGMAPGANGTFVITVQHHWVTDNGETLAIDQAQAIGMFVAPGLFAVTNYQVHLSGGTGRFAGAHGDMSAIGELDLNTGQAVLRYAGQVCYAPPND
jgi:hypothetical protein